jgi:hypothetical protein
MATIGGSGKQSFLIRRQLRLSVSELTYMFGWMLGTAGF